MIFLKAFLIGGTFCLIGQLLIDLTSYRITPAHILVGFVTGGVILSALGLYKPIVDFAGAGATVPLPGFGHLLAQGAIQGSQRGLMGAFGGSIEAAAVGIMAAVVFSFIVSVLFNPRGE